MCGMVEVCLKGKNCAERCSIADQLYYGRRYRRKKNVLFQARPLPPALHFKENNDLYLQQSSKNKAEQVLIRTGGGKQYSNPPGIFKDDRAYFQKFQPYCSAVTLRQLGSIEAQGA